MATRIAEDGFLEAGYNQVSIDDCWPNMERDEKTNRLVGNTTRFPSGIKALGDFMHSKNVRFGIYSDEGTKTCAGYPGSEGYEKIDAETFKDWGTFLYSCRNEFPRRVRLFPKTLGALQDRSLGVTDGAILRRPRETSA